MRKKSLAVLLSTAMTMTLLAGCGSASTATTAAKAASTGSKAAAATTAAAKAAATTAGTATTAAKAAGTTAAKKSVVSAHTKINFTFADGDAGAKTVINSIVDKFNKENPDITVTVVPGNGGTYSEFLKTKDSVGEFPDVMEMRDTAVYVRAGKLEELPNDVTSLFTSTMKFGGKVYAVPLSGENTEGIIYNKKYFDQNGFTEPKTYDEFLELCKKIKAKGDMSPLVVGGQDIWHMGFLWHKAYNDQVLSKDPDFIKHCYDGSKDFSDPTVKATFKEMQDIMQYAQDGWTSTPDAQITTFLVNNMSAMMYSGTHMFKQIKDASPDFEIGWFAVPSPDGKLRLVGGAGAGGLSVSAEAAKDPNKKAAAEAFIKFFFRKDIYKAYCETLSFVPVTVDKPTLDVPAVFQEVIEATGKADTLTPMWNGFTGDNELPPDFRNFTYKTLIEVLQGTRSIDSACDEMNKTWKTAESSFNPVKGIGQK